MGRNTGQTGAVNGLAGKSKPAEPAGTDKADATEPVCLPENKPVNKQPSKPAPHFHGPRRPMRFEPMGCEHLRHVLNLRSVSDAERLCEEAAVEIERLRAVEPQQSAFRD